MILFYGFFDFLCRLILPSSVCAGSLLLCQGWFLLKHVVALSHGVMI